MLLMKLKNMMKAVSRDPIKSMMKMDKTHSTNTNNTNEKKFKILAISDTHNDVSTIMKMAEKAEKENVDLVLLCGDITYFSRETKNIIGPFLQRGRKVMFIPGNHEDDATADFLAEFYNVRNLHGEGVVYDHVGFFGCGKGNIPINMISEEE